MFPDLERLITLQQLDATIADAKARIASHPQRLADADAKLAEARQALESARQRLKDNQESRRALEKDAAVFQGRLTKFKDQLSEVKTNREYQAMQHEIEAAQRELGVAEEKVLEHMMEGDVVAADATQAETALVASQAEVEREKAELASELATVQASLERATAARTALVAELEPRLLALYEHVSRSRRGVALCSATRDGLCSVCHVRLRPPVFQQVRHNSAIIQCESCQRILYYIPPPPPVEAPVVRTS